MEIATSILSSKDRIKSVQELNHTYSSYIHVDVMDGKFVSDVQFDTFEKIHSIHLVAKKPMDIHLMVDNPMEYIIQLSHMNIAFITFHLEIKKNIKEIIDKIHSMGYKASIAIKPSTDIKELTPYLDDIDMILVMCVEPGAGGRKFIPNSVDRIKEVKELIGNRNIFVEVDGGINGETIDKVRDVDISVVGSYIINSDNYSEIIDGLLNDCSDEKDSADDRDNKSSLNNIGSLLFLIFLVSMMISLFIFAFIEALANGSDFLNYLVLFYIFLIFVAFFWVVFKTIFGSKNKKR